MMTVRMLGVSLCLLLLGGMACSSAEKKDPVLTSLDSEDNKKPSDKAAAKPAAEDPSAAAKRAKEQDLKQAQMWARLEQLEQQVAQQREKLKLLEQGLLLGVPPDELNKKKAPPPAEKRPLAQQSPAHAPAGHTVVAPLPPPAATAGDLDLYRKRMQHAQELFQKGDYSHAYLEFSQLERDFEPKITQGSPSYWIGRCWLNLKEYQNAKQHFSALIADFPASPWQPSAKFYMAKADLGLGLRENAVTQLQNLIREHPQDGNAEAAKQLLATMNKTL